MPLDDLKTLGYTVAHDEASGTASVSGFGVATMIDPRDSSAIASLADPSAHAERRFQFLHPEAHAARNQLQAAGYTVERVDPSSDSFSISPPGAQSAPSSIGSQVVTPDQLAAMAEGIISTILPGA